MPRLSVIVPVYNQVEELTRCLAALSASQYDDFEVIVVDDGSHVPVEPLVVERGFNYLRIAGPGGPARARNRGAEKAQGRYLVFIDADVCVHPDTLTRFAETFTEDETIDAVIGSYDDSPGHPGFISQYKNLFHHYVHQQSNGSIKTFWTGCGAVKREIFFEFGGFDEKRYRRPAIEDIELGTLMSAAGRRIILDGRIKAKHLKKWTLLNLLKTDIFDRGIPWTRLMLRAGEMVSTLNVTRAQRLSVAFAYLSLILLLATTIYPKALIGAATLALTVTMLNRDFYRFFHRHKGFRFTLKVLPLHWLYFLYCGFSAAWGTLLHYKERLWIPLIIMIIGMFYLSTIRAGHRWGDDYCMYISHARNIVEGRPYGDTGYIYNPRRVISPRTYPPVFPLLLAPVYYFFGLNLIAMKVEVILIFLLALFIIYLTFRNELEWPYLTALIALIGFNPQLWVFKDHVLSDLPFLFFAYLSLYLIHQAYRVERTAALKMAFVILISAAIYLACGTRNIGLVLIPCLLIYHFIKSKKAGLFAIAIIMLIAGLIFIQFRSTHNISAYADHLGVNGLDAALLHIKKLIWSISIFWTQYSNDPIAQSLFVILSLLALTGYIARVVKRQITCFELFVPFYLAPLILLPIALESRFVIPLLPLYLFYIFIGLKTVSSLTAWRRESVEKFVFAGMVIILTVTYSIHFTRQDYGPIREGIGRPETQQLYEYVRNEIDKYDVVVFIKPRSLSLYTGRAASVWNNIRYDTELFDYFRRINAAYLVIGPPDLDSSDYKYIKEFVARNSEQFKQSFVNKDFLVYHIADSEK
ncbi:MAG: glycosyltransferase [Acidobacteria bacterium]|nr:glycosyltransferase [Acidobacteriota bacterium]